MEKVLINRLGRAGDGIARVDDADIYVANSLPGETVCGRIVNGRITGAVVETPATARVEPKCRHAGLCGGCTLQHASDEFLANWKSDVVRRALAARGLHAPVRPVRTSPPNSRRRAVFSGRRTKKTVVVGFHARASDDIVDIEECHIVRPEIVRARPALEALTQAGASRNSVVRLHVTHYQAGLDISVSDAKPLDQTLLAHLAQLTATYGLARLSWNGEMIVSRRLPVLRFGDADVAPPPDAFLQATSEGEAALAAAILDAVGSAGKVVDLFAGCGTFALRLAACAEVHAVEGDCAMLAALDKGWRGAAGLKLVTHEVRDLFRRPLLAAEINEFDAVVIDPPRAGAEAQCRELAASRLTRIAAVSCNPVTFARDAKILSDGGFQIDWIELVDQFRWSGHVELVAQMSR